MLALFLGTVAVSIGWATGYSTIGIALLLGAQLCFFFRFYAEGRLTGTGTFVFMYAIFFGIRPLYIFIEDDLSLFNGLLRVEGVDYEMLFGHMGWATAGLCLFVWGSEAIRAGFWSRLTDAFRKGDPAGFEMASAGKSFGLFLLFLQVITFLILTQIAGGSKRYLYGAELGAYFYDFPMVMQSVHIFAVIFFIIRARSGEPGNWKMLFLVSFILFLAYTFEMRNVSIFRGYYVTGLMIACIAMVYAVRGRVGYNFIVWPILLLLPFFGMLGDLRYQETPEVGARLATSAGDLLQPSSYWNFFSSDGDMNIFDSYVAASEYDTDVRPYFRSWLYVFVHWVPRAIWEGKPNKGLLIDHGFSRGAPYSAGISGYFVLQGGPYYMLFAMFLLGMVLAYVDYRIMLLKNDYFKVAAYAIFVVNGLFICRVVLYQSFYQVMYAIVPCLVLQYLMRVGGSRRTVMETPIYEDAASGASRREGSPASRL